MSGPKGLSIGPDGNVWTTDANTSKIYEFTPMGKLLLEIEVGGVAYEVFLPMFVWRAIEEVEANRGRRTGGRVRSRRPPRRTLWSQG